MIEEDLKRLLTGLARHLFGDVEMRWRDDFFPFTEPSFELDVFFKVQFSAILQYYALCLLTLLSVNAFCSLINCIRLHSK